MMIDNWLFVLAQNTALLAFLLIAFNVFIMFIVKNHFDLEVITQQKISAIHKFGSLFIVAFVALMMISSLFGTYSPRTELHSSLPDDPQEQEYNINSVELIKSPDKYKELGDKVKENLQRQDSAIQEITQ